MNDMKGKFLLVTLCLFSLNSFAAFTCYTVDKNDRYWKSPGQVEERACAVAMSMCSAHSPDGKSCKVYKVFGEEDKV